MAKHKDDEVSQVTRLKAWPKEIVSRQAPPEPEPPADDDDLIDEDGADEPQTDEEPRPRAKKTAAKAGGRKK